MVDFGNSWSSKNSESPLVRLGVSMDPLAMLFPGLGDWKVKTSDKLQGWVSKNIAKNDPFIKLERKYGPSHWFSELRPISDWALEKPLDATALTVGAVVAAPYAASAFGSGAGGAGGAGMWEGAFGGTTGLSGATYGAAPASGIPGIAGTIGGSTGAAASGLSAGQMAGLGATALGVMSPQQQQGAAMPPPQRQGNRFSRAMQAFPGAISGALFPTQPGVDASVSKAAQDQAMMAFAAGLLAGRDKPGASFGSAFGSAYQNASQTYSGALDNAFRNTLIRKQEEREERSEDREIARDKQKQRESAATTAGKLATGLQNSAGNMPGYWQMVASMPEVQGAIKELGIEVPTELDPGSWQQLQQRLAGAAQVGGPAAPRNPLQLKAVMGPQGKPILVREEQAEGMTPYYEPNTPASPSVPSGYRYTKSGTLEAIPGGPADMGGPAGRKATQPLRKEFRNLQSVKDYETVLPLVESAKNAPDTGYGDLQLIYSVGKVLDPGSVVREGELNLTIAAGSPMQRILGSTRFSLEQGGRLTPQVRQQILAMLAERVGAYEAAYNRDYEQYAQYAQEGGVDPSQVVGSHASSAYASGAPKVGTVEGGYRFKGGDPSDPKNWEKQ